MKAARLHSYGDIDQFAIDDIPIPKPVAGEILIKIEAFAVNPFDLMVRKGDMAQFIPLELPAVLNLIRHVRDGGQVASIVPVPDGANTGNRVRIHELYHRADAATLAAVASAASRGVLIIPIAKTFRLEHIGAAQAAVAAGSRSKVVLKH